jgi:hypothetical protein
MNQLERENRKLKRVVAQLTLDGRALKDVLLMVALTGIESESRYPMWSDLAVTS